MENRSVFEFDSYKLIMADRLSAEGRRGQLSRAAEALNCQPSFLSRVISTEIHITPEQAFLLSDFWSFEIEERDYFQTLVEWERAADSKYRDHLRGKISELKKNHESLHKELRKKIFLCQNNKPCIFHRGIGALYIF